MKIIAIIPARYGSTRFPGKPLAMLNDKPIIQWVIEGAKSSQLIQEVYVATDDERIANVVKSLGVSVLMTSSDCATGTDRVYEAAQNLEYDVVINIQGDEPQITKEYIDPLAEAFKADRHLDMATLAHPIEETDIHNLNSVKVIKNIRSEAIYFSRFPIPYSRMSFNAADNLSANVVEKHIGLYGYSRDFLNKFCLTPQAAIEKAESLEQLRALYMGAKIKVLTVAKPIQGVDTPEDLEKLKRML